MGSPERVVILGAGHAGATVAFALRELGYRGSLALVGDEHHLPYERPQLSKDLLAVGAPALKPMRELDAYAEHGIELVLGRAAVRVDDERRCVELSGGATLSYERLVIATGTRPRRLAIRGIGQRISYLRTADDAARIATSLELGERLVIVGGGVIGLEVAAAATARGTRPVVVERGPRLMTRSIDETLASHLVAVHEQRGVSFHFDATVEAFEAGHVVLSSGARVAADRVVVGIGVEPNLEAVAHLDITDEHGVRVDRFGRTARAHVFATGDVASQPGVGRIETWANAQDHARTVARNVLGEDAPYDATAWFWSDQGDLKLQVLGATSGDAIVRGSPASGRFSVFYVDGDGTVRGCAAVNQPRDVAIARRWMKDGVRVDRERLVGPDLQAARI